MQKEPTDQGRLYASADVAKLANLTPAAIRAAAVAGRITPVAVTAGGIRLYSQDAVDSFLRARQRRALRRESERAGRQAR